MVSDKAKLERASLFYVLKRSQRKLQIKLIANYNKAITKRKRKTK